jgi:hypothetical protein
MRLLNEHLTRLGDVEVVRYIDRYYRETYDGAMNWKVRTILKLSDLINAGITPITEIGYQFDGRDLLKFLENYQKPFDVSVRYEDSYARYQEQNRENADKERAKRKFIENAFPLFNPYFDFSRKLFRSK